MADPPKRSPYRVDDVPEPVPTTEAIFTASSLVEAQMVLDLLLEGDVGARIVGAHLAGAFGELPYRDSLPKIWLTNARDRDAALAIIAQYEARRAAVVDDVVECPDCGEESPANFELCWKCRAEL